MSPETTEASQFSPAIEDWKLRHSQDIQGGIEDWKVRHAERLAVENRRIDPTLSVDPVDRDNLGLRAVKSFANALILRETERARPTTTAVKGLTTLEETFDTIGPLPDDPTFGERAAFVPKFIASAWSVWFKNKVSAIRGEPTAEDFRIAKLKQIRGTWEADVPPAETGLEKGVDIAAGLSAFILQLAIARRVVPATLGTGRLANALAWELTNTEGLPGQGALMGSTLMAMHEIRLAGSISRATEITGTSALFAGTAAAGGAELEDIIISALIPPALAGIGAINRKLRTRIRTSRDSRFLERQMRADALKVLGLGPKPSLAEVKAAFRTLIKTTHPDVTTVKGAATETQNIVEAYHFLTGQGKYSPTLKSRKAHAAKAPKPPAPAEPTPEVAVARPAEAAPPTPPTAAVPVTPAPVPTVYKEEGGWFIRGIGIVDPEITSQLEAELAKQPVPADQAERERLHIPKRQTVVIPEAIQKQVQALIPAEAEVPPAPPEPEAPPVTPLSQQVPPEVSARAKTRSLDLLRWYKGEPIEVTPAKLLYYSLTHEARGARKGYRAGQLDLNAKHREMTDFAKKNLPMHEQKLIARALEKISKSRTPAQVRAVIRSINLMAKSYERSAAVIEFREAMKTAKEKGGLLPEFEKEVDAIINEFSVVKRTARIRKRFESVLKAAKIDKLDEIPQKLVIEAREALDRATKPLLRDMPPQDIRAITQAVQMLVAQSSQTKLFINKGKHREIVKATRETAAEVTALHPATPTGAPGEFSELTASQPPLLKAVTWDQLNLNTNTTIVFGETGTGKDLTYKHLKISHRDFLRLLQQAEDMVGKTLAEQEITPEILSLWSKAYGGRFSKQDVQTIETPTATTRAGVPVPQVQMTVAELMEFYNFFQDPQNRAAGIRNKQDGFLFDRDPSAESIKFTIQDVANIEAKMRENPKALALANTLFEIANGPLRDAVNITSMAEFLTTIWPRTNSWSRRRSQEFTHKDPNKVIEKYQVLMFENMGIFLKRTGGTEPFRIGDIFNTFYAHLNKGAGYAHKTRAVHDALRILDERDVQQAIRHGFKHGDDRIKDIRNAVVAYQGMGIIRPSGFTRFIDGALRRGQMALIGGKAHIIAFQGISFLNALNEIEAKWLFPAISFSYETLQATKAEMRANSPPLRARIDGTGHEILSPTIASPAMQQFFGKPSKLLESATVGPIHASDMNVIATIWRAAKAKLSSQGLTGQELLDETAMMTENIVDNTQPSWDMMTLSTLGISARTNPFIKIFGLMFSSQRSKNMQQVVLGTVRFKRSQKTRADWQRLAKAWTIPTIVNAVALVAITYGKDEAIKALWRIIGVGKYDPKKDAVDLWLDFAQRILERIFGNVLVFGEVPNETARAAIRGVMQEPANLSPRTNIVTSTSIKTYQAVEDISRGISERAEGEEEKGKRLIIRGIDKALSVAGTGIGFPYDGLSGYAKPKIKEITKKPEN